MISKSPEDLQYYEDRLKFLRDEQGKLEAAREEGREEGRRATIVDTIRILEDLLGVPRSDSSANEMQSLDALAANVAELQQRLRDRQT